MPLARAVGEEGERPPWVQELPDRPASVEDAFSLAIEHSEGEGLRFLNDLVSGRWRWGPFLALGNDSRGLAGVHVAVLCKRYRTLGALLARGVVNINQPSTNPAKKGWTALHFAAFLVDLEAIRILLDHNCATSALTELGSTPLHFVTGRFGNRGPHLQHHIHSIVKTLLRAGVDPEATNRYGFTVLHESIVWGDVTSLCVLLEQSTAQYFKRLLLIGSHVLPHELAWRLPTLPVPLKTCLERSFFLQKRMKESMGVSSKVNLHDYQVYESLECISNPSPPTVERIRFPNPESLTATQVGSLLRSAPQSLVVEVLRHQQSIVEYKHCSFNETRYVFPAYFSHTLAEWVCIDCRNCRVVAGRWFSLATENAGRNLVVQLMALLLSDTSFPKHTAVDCAAYFSTRTGVQLGIRYVDRVRSQGVMVQVCAASDETATECRRLIDYVIDSAHRLHGGIGPVSVVSSRDLKAGKKIPHLFSLGEVNCALATRQTFLANPALMHTADTIADLLLDSQAQIEAVECDFALNAPVAQTTPYRYDVWSEDVYCRAVENHTDDIAKLADPIVIADSLVSEGVFSSSDRSDIISAEDEEKIPCLLKKVEEKRAYCSCFVILRETGEQLPAHGRLWDILNDTCSDIHSCGSLNNFFLEEEGPHSAPPHCRPAQPVPVGPRTAPSGRVTEESGIGTQSSVQFLDLLTQPPSHLRSSLSSYSLPPVSPPSTQPLAAPSFKPCEQCGEAAHSFVSSVCQYTASVTCVDGCALRGEEGACGRDSLFVPTAVSVSVDLESSFTASTPITIPRPSSLSYSLGREDSTSHPQPNATKGTLAPKHLPQRPSVFQRLLDALFSAPTPSTFEENYLPGLKQF